jgi:hypothetical protein
MTHARPVLIDALRAWGLNDAATNIERATSLGALKGASSEAAAAIRRAIIFLPLRRDLFQAAKTLQVASTFAVRGDAQNTSAVVVGVFVGAASAMTWRRPWQRFAWRKQRAQIIAETMRAQQEYLTQNI